MKDNHHVFTVLGNEREGYWIKWQNVDGRGANFIGSNNNVRIWKKKELAERHAQRLRDGLSKISTA